MFLTVNLAQNQSKISNYISDTLLEHIDLTLEKWEKVMLYLNKRGSHSSLICEACQYLYSCPNCDVSLSVHSNPDHLRCHICNNAFNIPKQCSQCNKANLKAIGVGTQQIEKVLREYYVNKPSHLNSLSKISHPWIPSPLEEREATVGNRKYELKSPWYIFELAKWFRMKPTQQEELVWNVVRSNKLLDIKFRRQHPIGRYIADFYSEELLLIIEVDGKIHEEISQKEYDIQRNELIQAYWYKIFRIKNEDLENKTENEIKISLQENIAALLSSKGQVREGTQWLSQSWSEAEEIQRWGRGFERGVLWIGEARWGQDFKWGKINYPTIYRFDSDSMKNISSKREALWNLDTADIIIGTKMLTTGFNFEKIWLICILLVESELSYPSYDAAEKAYTNLRQLIGRGNRKSQQTTLMLQTFIPKHPLVQQLTNNNFKDFFQETLRERKEFDYPPYKQMVTLEYRHKDSKKSLAYTQKLLEDLQKIDETQEYQFLRGSSTFKKNNTHHATIIVKWKNVRKLLKHIEKTIISQSALSVIFH